MKFKELALDGGLLRIAPLAAAIATAAAFGKQFVPFYLVGSTPIFTTLCAISVVLIALSWRSIGDQTNYISDVLVALSLLYGIVTISYLVHSVHEVPVTHLLGILISHFLFISFGFAAARSLPAVFSMLIGQAAIYLVYIFSYIMRFGAVMHNGTLQNVFGLEDPGLSIALHQQIASALGLALLAALGFSSKGIRLLAFAALPFVFAFVVYVSARTALVALTFALIFLSWVKLWGVSKKWASTGLAALILSAVVASTLFYRFALHDEVVNADAPNIVKRTVEEIQSRNPGFRLPIWNRAWHRLASDPDQLLLGRGVGVFPIDEGAGAPDWLLRKTEAAKHYPHNAHLEVLYESGIFALTAFGFLSLLPFAFALKYWTQLVVRERACILLYAFYLASVDISGSFAYSYDFIFFLGLAIGVISLKRKEFAETSSSAIGSHHPSILMPNANCRPSRT